MATKRSKLIGTTAKLVRLDTLRPNDWNSNEFTPEERRALREGLKADGWAVSQALLVWATDEKGQKQNVIVDGEHRWEEASRLGFEHGPAVELRGITREQAVAWTLRLAKVRGQLNDKKTAKVLDAELGVFSGRPGRQDFALRIGFTPDEVERLRLRLPERAAAGGRAVTEPKKPIDPRHTCPSCGHRF